MNKFEYTDADGGRLAIKPLPGVPYILLMTDLEGAAVPLDRVEEVVAGLRDMARQAGGQAAALPGAPITAEQHARAREVVPDGAVITAAALRAGLSVAERQFLSFALDLAADRMASEDGFSVEDQAALDHFRRMTVDEP